MALDFTKLKDQHGAAIFLIHDGTERVKEEFETLAADIGRRTKKQIIELNVREAPGSEIVKFYGLRGSRFVLIVRDDDQLHHVWSDGERFDASHIAYTAEQAG